jgi:hypothetical protein
MNTDTLLILLEEKVKELDAKIAEINAVLDYYAPTRVSRLIVRKEKQ